MNDDNLHCYFWILSVYLASVYYYSILIDDSFLDFGTQNSLLRNGLQLGVIHNPAQDTLEITKRNYSKTGKQMFTDEWIKIWYICRYGTQVDKDMAHMYGFFSHKKE